MTRPSATPAMSLRDFAKRRGVSAMAVSKAVKTGRLKKSVTHDPRGQPKIADPELADREWDASTDYSKAPGYVKERASARAAAAAPPARRENVPTKAPPPPPPDPDGDQINEPADLSLAEESAREKFWKAHLAELEYRRRAGEVLDASVVKGRMVDAFARCRTKLLGVPSRMRQQIPHLTAQDVVVVESLVREALEELAAEAQPDPGDDAPALEAAGAAA